MTLSTRLKQFSWWHEAVLFLLLIVLLAVAGVVKPDFLQWRGAR